MQTEKRKFAVRLKGIDAPELAQAFGPNSQKHLASMVFDKQVRIVWTKHDKYNRRVGKVLIDGTDACLSQLRSGCAWHYRQYAKEQTPRDRTRYAAAEREARRYRRGLWRSTKAAAPWGWRHRVTRITAVR